MAHLAWASARRALEAGAGEGHADMPIIQVKVHPNSRTPCLEQLAGGSFIARLKAPPVDGKANAELVALVARRFGVAKSAVTIKAGAGARLKLVCVASD